jgi:hypothetical protein
MRASRTEYLFSVNTRTPPTMTVASGEEFTVDVRGTIDDVEDISPVPTPFTPGFEGHLLATTAGESSCAASSPTISSRSTVAPERVR